MAEITEIKSSDILKNCYGVERKQKSGSCWFDSTLEILFNSDVIGEIVRTNCYDYGLYNGRVVPYRVKLSLIDRFRVENFLLFMILNYVLFNLEITNEPDYIVFGEDDYSIRRKDELEVCEIGFENFLAKIKHILEYYNYKKDIKKKDGTPKYELDLSLPSVLSANSYGGHSYYLYELFFKKVPELDHYVNKVEYYGPDLTSKKSHEKDRRFPVTAVLFNRIKFLATSLSFKGHATSVIRCSDKIFYYDNNAPINLKTKRRNTDFSEVVKKDGSIEKHPEYLEKFWTEGLDYLKHWGDYFNRYKGKEYDFDYIDRVRARDYEFFNRVTIFEKKEGREFKKNISLDKLDDSISLKDILSCELLKAKDIISAKTVDPERTKLIKDCFEIVTNDLELYKNKYLLYKRKYLQLKNKIDAKL